VSHDKLSAYLHASDIFIRPSLSEGLGSSFIEAMRQNPVIATPVGGYGFFNDGKTGYFCRPSDSQSIADTILKIIADGKKIPLSIAPTFGLQKL